MATLRDIRQRINGVANTAKITQAMRMVSAAKMRRAQDAIQSARPYVLKLSDVLTNLVTAVGEDYSHPLIEKHPHTNSVAVIVLGSEGGLCGSFNINLFRNAVSYIEDTLKTEHPNATVSVIPIGKRSVNFFKKKPYPILNEFAGVFQNLKFSSVADIIEPVKAQFVEQKIDRVVVFFNEFKNLLTQVPKHLVLLPIENQTQQQKNETQDSKEYNLDYIFEPQQKAILDELLPKHIDIQMWRTLLESNAAEQAARMVAMENATNNAYELIKHLELVFNKARQSAITTEMLEIVSGADALKKS